jgi:hypothetical protein
VTDEQINAIIATSLGFIEEEPWLNGKICWSHIDHPNVGFESIPDFSNDLNACHEFEKMLDGMNQISYLAKLHENNHYCSWGGTCATARQRCEAYLRTLGKWIE